MGMRIQKSYWIEIVATKHFKIKVFASSKACNACHSTESLKIQKSIFQKKKQSPVIPTLLFSEHYIFEFELLACLKPYIKLGNINSICHNQ